MTIFQASEWGYFLHIMLKDIFTRECNPTRLLQLKIQCLTTILGLLLNSLWKWGHFDRAKSTLKMLLASWFLLYFLKRFRSFYDKNLGPVGQRAAKLPAIKLWGWFDHGYSQTRADRFECGSGWKADFFLRPPTLIVSNFEAL